MANRNSSVLGCVAAIAVLLGQVAWAADPIGTVKTLGGAATITREGAAIPATLGMSVFQADTIATAAGGRIGITFVDNSTMSLGPNASLSLDTFRFDSTTYEGQFQTTLKQGTLAAVSGRIAKQTPEAMTVRTPSAILGVRGTKFVVQAGGG
ncbi:MAG: FecR domain-containing protein [Rhodospirillaceae bacterium]|nr:FecR domain-containing protein [Rhodospirillaceae bacterium]